MRVSPVAHICCLLGFAVSCLAHPLPDVAVRANFESGGGWMLQVEIDPRSFEPDPNVAPYLTHADLNAATDEFKEKLKATARDYIRRVVDVVLDPLQKVNPAFDWQFTTMENAPLRLPEDPVMLTGTWKTQIPQGATGYSIRALPEGTLSVLYHNTALGKKIERFQILFPGETSYVLDLRSFQPRTAAPPLVTASPEETSPEAMCPMCGPGGGSSTLTAAVLSAAAIIALVIWLSRRRKPDGE